MVENKRSTYLPNIIESMKKLTLKIESKYTRIFTCLVLANCYEIHPNTNYIKNKE